MKPATEVGGDYYDFHVSSDGTLTVAVGDATGHGLKAGTVVTATKGLFNNLAASPDIADTFGQISRSLKAMNLRGLFMAMTMLKINGNRAVVCMAGMPSILIYRAAIKQVEEIAIRAMPLGSFSKSAYDSQELTLLAGDAVVLMSDGFPEMFNETGEMLPDMTAKNLLTEIAAESPQEIIDHFVQAGEKWAGTRPPDDDVTFVVLKVKTGSDDDI
jgi:serine phosphatase RsbU (regulator of sigma subunit)